MTQIENKVRTEKALGMGLALGITPTLLLLPLSTMAGFGPCGAGVHEGMGPFVILLVVTAFVCIAASLRYLYRAFRGARVLTGLTGGALLVWNGLLSLFLLALLSAALA